MIYTKEKKDLILPIASITQNNNLTLKRINTIKIDDKYAFEIKVSVPNLDTLNKYMNALLTIDGVDSVERVIK